MWDDHEVADNTYRDGSSGTYITETSFSFPVLIRLVESGQSLIPLSCFLALSCELKLIYGIHSLTLQHCLELNNTEASFIGDGGVSVDQRKMNAVRAYFEWMPIRQVEMDDNLRIWRSFSIGTLLDLIMLDTRQYDRSITDLYWNTHYVHQISNDAGRSMMGSRQENWFFGQLKSSAQRAATWSMSFRSLSFPFWTGT